MMKKQRTNLSATKINGFLAVLFILTFTVFAAAQTARQFSKEAEKANEVNLNFINRTNYPATIYQLIAGKEKLYKTVSPDNSFSQSTFRNRQWRVRMNGKLIGTYVATTAPQQEIEITVSKSEAAMKLRNQKDAQKHCIPMVPNSPAVWIGKWGSLGEGQPSWCEFAQLHISEQKEEAASKGISLVFENQTQLPYQLFKLDENGIETSSSRIPASGKFTQLTFATNKWRLKMTDGRTLGEYTATDQDSQKIEIIYAGLMRLPNAKNQKNAEEKCRQSAGNGWSGKAWLGSESEAVCEGVSMRTRSDLNEASPKAITLNFENQTELPIQLYSVNENDREILSGEIAAGSSFMQLTFAQQKWKLKFTDGRTLFEWSVREQESGKHNIRYGEILRIGKVKNQKDAEVKCSKMTRNWGRAMVENGNEGTCEGIAVEFIPDPRTNPNNAQKEVSLSLINKTKAPVDFFWVEESGKENLYGQIAAGLAQTQNTYASHKWRLKLNCGITIGEYTATDQDSQKVEILYGLTPVKQIRNRKEAEQECNKATATKGGFWTGSWAEVGDFDHPVCQVIRLRIGT